MTTLDTAAAAEQARVSVATIRTWCRRGVITATKEAGRWIIDADSLAARIANGKMQRPAPARKIVYSVETMTAIGGRRWQKNGMDRVYLDWAAFAGIEVTRFNTGSISSASYQGNSISNSQARKILGSIDKVWYDAADGNLHCRYGLDQSRVASREEVWAAVVAGIRAAIAAL